MEGAHQQVRAYAVALLWVSEGTELTAGFREALLCELSQRLLVFLRKLCSEPSPPEPKSFPAEIVLVAAAAPVTEQDIYGAKSLLLEVVRRAASDWVLYRSSTRLLQKELAEEAHRWLFLEDETHLDHQCRKESGKELTSFLAICEALGLQPELLRDRIRKLTPQQIVGMGRPAEYRRISSQTKHLKG